MKPQALDLNLLRVFDAIWRCRSVTAAGAEVGLTQGSMSNALNRLRQHFDDPLFARLQGRMQPTLLAESLAEPVQLALRQLDQALTQRRAFEPATAANGFRICMTEIAQRVFLPRLMQHLAQQAPLVQLATVDMPPERAQAALAAGEIDLAIGYFAAFGDSFFAQRLFSEHYVALVRAGHPAIGTRLTRAAYLQAAHISYRPAAASHELLDERLDRAFTRAGVRRRVGLQVAHSMGLSVVVSQTDLIATVPSRLALSFADQPALRVLPLPLAVPAIEIRQHWHLRSHQDPASQWLRAQIAALFQA